MTAQIVLYELNEVPWEIVDFYLGRRPNSALARLLPGAATQTTVSEERTNDLQPWRSWPTLHRSLWTRDHNSWDLGQDHETFRGVDFWTVAARAGRRVGVFGALQSWPPRHFPGGFHVPDTFARTPETFPASLKRFQAFNLTMTAENRFAADARLPMRHLPIVAADLFRHGLKPSSAFKLARHLLAERVDGSKAIRRPMMQALPSFDLFWRLQQRYQPDLSIFFTNHVASMLHRYWEDALPSAGGSVGPGASAVLSALDIFDVQLDRMVRWQREDRKRVLVIASSMGQERVGKWEMGSSFVVDDAAKLAAALHMPEAEPAVGMYPTQALLFATAQSAEMALDLLRAVEHDGGPMFAQLRRHGRSISFEVDYISDAASLSPRVTYGRADGDRATGSIADLGISVRTRPSGSNSGEHMQRGTLIAAGGPIQADDSRGEVSVLDVAPSLLGLMGLAPDESMAGRPSLFDVESGQVRPTAHS